MKIKNLIITLSFIMSCLTCIAQNKSHVNYKYAEGEYLSYPITPQQKVTWHRSLDNSDPEGTIRRFGSKLGIVLDLGGSIGKVAVALSNEGTDDPYAAGEYFDSQEAEHYTFSDGWRLPTTQELEAIANMYSKVWNGEKKGLEWTFNNDGNQTSLFFPAAGFYYRNGNQPLELGNFGIEGNYWSSDINGNDHYFLMFGPNGNGVNYEERGSKHDSRYNIRAFHTLSSTESYYVSFFGADGSQFILPFDENKAIIFGEDLEGKHISSKSSLGTVGIIDGREAIVVELSGKKVAVATMNVGASSIYEGEGGVTTWADGAPCHGDYMPYHLAKQQEDRGEWGPGWRLPTRDEINSLIEQISKKDNSSSYALKFPAKGTELFLPETGGFQAYWDGFKIIDSGFFAWIEGGDLFSADSPYSLVGPLIMDNMGGGVPYYTDFEEEMIIYSQFFVRPFHDLE